MKKITLKGFFDSKEKLAIHCDTEEKANKLLKEFHRLGKKWTDGDSYLDGNLYTSYNDRTCYSNNVQYCSVEYYEKIDYKVYSFEDIILEEQDLSTIEKTSQLTDAERVILENLPKECNWVARDEGDYLFVYEDIPRKVDSAWVCSSKNFEGLPFYHLFQFIKWEDEEPYNIEELLKGE